MKNKIFKSKNLPFVELRYVEKMIECSKLHIHEELTITSIKEGALNILFKDETKQLSSNELVIINSSVPHSATLNDKESKDGYVLYLNQDYLYKLGINFNLPHKFIKEKDIYEDFINLCDCLLDKKVSLLEKEEIIISLCFLLFDLEDKIFEKDVKDTLPLKIKEYLDKNYLEDIVLADLSKYFDLSIIHLIRIFKKEFGLPIHAYILNKKVHKAKELLALGLSIVEVSQESGFFDQSHLNRCFKRIFQFSPKEYQKSIFS